MTSSRTWAPMSSSTIVPPTSPPTSVDLAARTRAAGRRFAGLSVEPDYPALEALADLAESGRLRVRLQATLDLAEAAKAHELLESGSVTGNIALTV